MKSIILDGMEICFNALYLEERSRKQNVFLI